MKISKIPGLGRFGIYIDDVNFDHMSDQEWQEIGQLHLQNLVTVIRAPRITPETYYKRFLEWGTPRWNRPIYFLQKYGKTLREIVKENLFDEEDKNIVAHSRNWQLDKRYPGMIRVTAKVDGRGRSLGVFSDGELLWHSNECADTAFTPGVALMGYESMGGSCTGFCTSTDWYETQSEAFRSELDEMIVVHNYESRRLNPVYFEDQEKFYRSNMCPTPDSEVPLVIQSPSGIKGLHLGINTFDCVKGMSKESSDELFAKIKKEMIADKYIYEHWHGTDHDILIFDNSITLHNRKLENGISPDRIGLRIQFDYDKLNPVYDPFFQAEYNITRQKRLDLLTYALS